MQRFIKKKKSLPTKKHFLSLLKNQKNETFFITSSTIKDRNYVICDLKTSKRTGASSLLPIKVMKQLNKIIVSPLVELNNKSFQSGVFPDILKITKVFPIFKCNSVSTLQ